MATKLYDVIGYYNTGFDRFNVPDSLSLLKTCESRTFNQCMLRQNEFIQNISIQGGWEQVRDMDYIIAGTAAYFVTGIKMLNEATAQVSIELDALTTIGIGNLDIVSAWCKRRHVASDPIFENDINEPFQPRTSLQLDEGNEIGLGLPYPAWDVVASTVSLSEDDLKEAQEYVDQSTSTSVTCPKVYPVRKETISFMPTGNDSYAQWRIPMTALYVPPMVGSPNPATAGIGKLRALGLENAITASYSVPVGHVTFVASADNMSASEIRGVTEVKDSGLNFRFGSYKNNKVYSGQYTRYTLVNAATGNSGEFIPEEIYSNSGAVEVRIFSDPSPSGRCYARPNMYKGRETPFYIQAISGPQWLSTPIRFEGEQFSGWAQSMKRYTFSQTSAKASYDYAMTQYGMNFLGGAINAAGNVSADGVAPTGVASGLMGLASRGLEVEYNKYQYEQQRNQNAQATVDLARPEIIFPQTDSMAAYYGHTFLMYRTRMTDSDMQRFDKFLTMYGYAVDEPFDSSALNCRMKFNYLTLSDVQCKIKGEGNYWGKAIVDAAKSVLEGGVRIWHVLPNAAAFNDNPIKEA